MNIRMTKGLRLALLGTLLLGATAANATVLSFFLTNTNVNPLLPDGVYNYLQVTIEDGATAGGDALGNSVKFTVDWLGGGSPVTPDSSFGIQGFRFNVADTTNVSTAVWVLPANWNVLAPPGTQNGDGYGTFEVATGTSGQNNRVDPLVFWLTNVTGDTAASYVALSGGTAAQGNANFAAHVAGFVDLGPLGTEPVTTSAWFGDAVPGDIVPVPAAVWLFGSGLGLMGLVRRRKAA